MTAAPLCSGEQAEAQVRQALAGMQQRRRVVLFELLKLIRHCQRGEASAARRDGAAFAGQRWLADKLRDPAGLRASTRTVARGLGTLRQLGLVATRRRGHRHSGLTWLTALGQRAIDERWCHRKLARQGGETGRSAPQKWHDIASGSGSSGSEDLQSRAATAARQVSGEVGMAQDLREVEAEAKARADSKLRAKVTVRSLEVAWTLGCGQQRPAPTTPVEGFSAKDKLVAAAWLKRLVDGESQRRLLDMARWSAACWRDVIVRPGFWMKAPPQVPCFLVFHAMRVVFASAYDEFEREWAAAEAEYRREEERLNALYGV
jgi:hypothetical protein